MGTGFSSVAWQGIVAVDLLDRLARSIRPYAIDAARVDRLYRSGLKEIVRAVSRREDLLRVLRRIRDSFNSIEKYPSIQVPVVGVVGEIYTRTNSQANAELVKELEGLGVRVLLPSVSEWILYSNLTAIRRARRTGTWREFARLHIENLVQIRDIRRLESAVLPLDEGRESLTNEIIKMARPFLSDEFEGESILSVGKAVEFIQKGVSGIINVMPLTCMPGTIVNALLKRVRDEIGNRPLLPLPCDGQQETLRSLRLEAFVYQARRQYMDERDAVLHRAAERGPVFSA